MNGLSIAVAQLDFTVGAIDENARIIIDAVARAKAELKADLVVFPELSLTGYPPEDLLLRPSLQSRVEQAIASISSSLSEDQGLILGFPWQEGGKLYNAAGLITAKGLESLSFKSCLPNYQVFDEQRYFSAASEPTVFESKGQRLGICICEDIWHDKTVAALKGQPLDGVISLNASPFHVGKQQERKQLIQKQAAAIGKPVIYVNLVGGQDELVFDGGSFGVDAEGRVEWELSRFEEKLVSLASFKNPSVKPLSELEEIYQALVMGVQAYVDKNRFSGVVLGLSGGIDSALTLAIAVDALGADRVQAIMMPYKYTSSMSMNDAQTQAATMGVDYQVVPIADVYDAFMAGLSPLFKGKGKDTTEENLQSRARGVLLMAVSNKTGKMVLTTGNKSEMAVGYATLYGDMCGGYNALKDVFKTRVFELARYRNSISEVIPERVITRPPSAELAPDQQDSDSLPDYPVLDEILTRYIEQDQSAEAIVGAGFSKEEVYRVCRLVDINEYKRRQAPVGTRITLRGFGRDRRYPMTNGWKLGE